MPGDAKVQSVHLILFANPEVDTKVLEFCNRFALMASIEYGERKHYHIAIHLKEEVSYKTFRKYLSDHISPDLKGTTSFKTKEWVDYGKNCNLEQYICKGVSPEQGPEMLMNRTLIESATHHLNYWKQPKESKDSAKEKAKAAHLKGTKIIEDICARHHNEYVKTEEIIREVLDAYQGRTNDIQMFTIVQAIMYKLDKVKTTDNVVNRLMRKFSN